MLTAVPREASDGFFLPCRWGLALVCSLALLLGASLFAAGEADAQGRGNGHDSPNKAAHEPGGAPRSDRPAERSSHQPSDRRSDSRPAGHSPSHSRPENDPARGGGRGSHQRAARDPEHRTHGQPSNNRQPARERPSHRAPVDREPAHGRSARGQDSGSAHRPDNSGPTARQAGWGQAKHDEFTRPQGAAAPPEHAKRHERAEAPGQVRHDGPAAPENRKPAEPPGRAKHYEAGKTTGPVKRQEAAEPGAAPPGQVKLQEPRQPAGYRVTAPPAKEKVGSGVATGRAGRPEHQVRRVGGRQPSSLPVGGLDPEFSGRAGEEFSGHAGPLEPPVAGNARRHAVQSVRRSAPSTLQGGSEDRSGHSLEVAVGAVQGDFAKRASLAFERLWGAAGSMLERVGKTADGILETVTSFLSGARPAGDLGSRGPPVGLPPTSSGTGSLIGNFLSVAGSSGGGFGPLLAVLALLAIIARMGRFWVLYEISKPQLVPRLIHERPG